MKQTFIFGGIALVLVVGIGAALLYFTGPREGDGDGAERGGFFGSLFPFGTGDRGQGIGDRGSETDEQPQNEREVPRLRKVSDKPASGGILFENGDGAPEIRYVERATGHVYETSAASLATKRVSNTTVPGIEEALWISKNRFVMRYLNDAGEIETFLANLASTTAEQTLSGKFLPSWERAALDPSGQTILSLEEGASGSTLYLTKSDGTEKQAVYSSPIRSWVPLQSDNVLYLESAPASGFPGFLYRVSGQNLVKVLDNVPGLLSVVSPKGRYVLFSTGGEDTFELFLLDTADGTVYESPVETLAVKCAFVAESPVVACGVPSFSPEGAYPADWLLGRATFSDDLWLIDVASSVAQLVSVPANDAGAAIDVVNPFTDENGTYFGFINKNDLSLWVLRLFNENKPTS